MLSFDTLREANKRRLPEFRNKKGELTHPIGDGSDWTPGEWVTAVTGELGEAANIVKKVRRGDMTLDEARPALASELADAVTYLDLLAMTLGIDLGEAVRKKFNEVSERVGANVCIESDDEWHQRWPTHPGATVAKEHRDAYSRSLKVRQGH